MGVFKFCARMDQCGYGALRYEHLYYYGSFFIGHTFCVELGRICFSILQIQTK